MLVKAKEGLRVPREDNARRYIADEPVEVPQTSYYLRRIMDGDLEKLEEDMPSPVKVNRVKRIDEPAAPLASDALGEPVALKDKE